MTENALMITMRQCHALGENGRQVLGELGPWVARLLRRARRHPLMAVLLGMSRTAIVSLAGHSMGDQTRFQLLGTQTRRRHLTGETQEDEVCLPSNHHMLVLLLLSQEDSQRLCLLTAWECHAQMAGPKS